MDLCGYLWIFVDIIASSLIYMLVGLKGDEKKELMLKLMKATSKLYDMEVAISSTAGSTSSLPAPSGN